MVALASNWEKDKREKEGRRSSFSTAQAIGQPQSEAILRG
jgi:hypothetical protein